MVLAKLDFLTSFQLRQGERFRPTQYRLTKGLGGGGVIMDMGIHGIDLMRYVLADEVDSVGLSMIIWCTTARLRTRRCCSSDFGRDPWHHQYERWHSVRTERAGAVQRPRAIISERSLARVPDPVRVRVLLDGTWAEYTAPNVDSFRRRSSASWPA